MIKHKLQSKACGRMSSMKHPHTPLVLVILDGFGHREASEHNPIAHVDTPTFDSLFEKYPNTLLSASGKDVGLPDGQMGNSEVGHLHLGAGRKIPQDLTRIDHDVATGAFAQNTALLDAIHQAKQHQSAIHVIGLLSPGGVHSHEDHILSLITLLAQQGVEQHYLHAILDGRDTPPQSALPSLQKTASLYQTLGSGHIATVMGRYYAMDRDKRWERTQKAYDALTLGKFEHQADNAEAALQLAYARDENDEFVLPTACYQQDGKPVTINDGDVVIFMNFRADRARQLSHALTDKTDNDFPGFARQAKPELSTFVTLTEYDETLAATIAYPPLTIRNTLGEYLSTQDYRQLRIAETEKYAHVTYFFNGGIETPFPQEERLMIPSPKVATYDLQPEMSANALTDELTRAIESGDFDVIICNYANPDMVGHTGVKQAARQAVTAMDACMQRLLISLRKVNGEALITSDHGNIECMFDERTKQPHTAHTTNLVPLIYIGRPAKFIHVDGALDDVAPTLLHLLGLPVPKDMTGRCLLNLIS